MVEDFKVHRADMRMNVVEINDTRLPERFWEKVGLGNVHENVRGRCWVWSACCYVNGYGMYWFEGKLRRAHRVAYETLVGPIHEGLNIDHLCRVRNCVRPSHLEPVTQKVNVLRGEGPTAINAKKTHCGHGHEFTDENTYIYPVTKRNPSAQRMCRECKRICNRAYYRRKKGTK